MVYFYVLNGDAPHPHSNKTHGPVFVNNAFDATTIFNNLKVEFAELDP